jgi:hypothetical protein
MYYGAIVRDGKAKAFTTAAGGVKLRRVYFVYRVCRQGECALDRRLGGQGSISRQRLPSLNASA